MRTIRPSRHGDDRSKAMTQELTATRSLGRRLLAGAGLLVMGLFWLVAWLPIGVFCLAAALVSALRPRHARFENTLPPRRPGHEPTTPRVHQQI
jgi:hypothetical protein